MNVLMPPPRADFDRVDAAINWRVLRDAGHAVVFVTRDGPVCASRENVDFRIL